MDIKRLQIRRSEIIENIEWLENDKREIERLIAEKSCPFTIGDKVMSIGGRGTDDHYIVVGYQYDGICGCDVLGARIKKNGQPYNEANSLWGELKKVE